MSNWIEVGNLSEIPRAGARVIKTGGTDIAVFRTGDDTVLAVDNKCPHKSGPLSDGIVHGCQVTCPLHNWILDLRTGKALAPDEGRVRTWPVRVSKGKVLLAAGNRDSRQENRTAVNA